MTRRTYISPIISPLLISECDSDTTPWQSSIQPRTNTIGSRQFLRQKEERVKKTEHSRYTVFFCRYPGVIRLFLNSIDFNVSYVSSSWGGRCTGEGGLKRSCVFLWRKTFGAADRHSSSTVTICNRVGANAATKLHSAASYCNINDTRVYYRKISVITVTFQGRAPGFMCNGRL